MEYLDADSSMDKCLVCTKKKGRIVNVLRSTLFGFGLYDAHIRTVVCLPNPERLLLIITESYRNGYYSIVLMAEVYDFIVDHQSIVSNFKVFASSDGSTPLARTMCLLFNKASKLTARIVTHGDGPKVDRNFTYNFLTENYTGVVKPGWTLIRGLPWNVDLTSQKSTPMEFIGVIGSPGGSRFFGIESWLIPIILKMNKDNLKVKIRLHPQAYKFSGYLIGIFLGSEVSHNESENEFISSVRCLVTTYRSTLIDLAILLNRPVILNSKQDNLNVIKGTLEINSLDFRKDYKKILELCNKEKRKNMNDNLRLNESNPPHPSIREIISF